MSPRAFDLLHSGVQHAIYEMRWTSLRDLQVRSIFSLLQTNKHLLLSAQTAGGKTEAAFLPIISRLAEHPLPSVQTLYVGPLKALINDQFQRLSDLCSHLHIPVHGWHGDISASRKKKFRENPGGILLITPESLESNFINYGSELGRLYKHLSYVVVDELHTFLGGVRGIHLQSLLSRLEQASGAKPRYIGLSATLGDPLEARMFLSRDNPDNVEVIKDETDSRTIRFLIRGILAATLKKGENQGQFTADEADQLQKVLLSEDSTTFEALLENLLSGKSTDVTDEWDSVAEDIIRHCSKSTNLVFANARNQIELLADRLHERVNHDNWPVDPFYVHHSSVSKELREEAEERAKSGVPTTVVCSSTLELGIDIGSVRAVYQVNPPHSVASALQRLGRSGRREGEDSVMRIYAIDDPPEANSTIANLLYPSLLQSIAIARLMFMHKWLEPVNEDRMELSTLVHQVLSCLKQTGGMKALSLFDLLVTKGPFRKVSSDDFVSLLRGLSKSQIVEQMPDGMIILAPGGERITGCHDFYAAFLSSDEMSVRCNENQIGKIERQSVPNVGEHLLLTGRRWQVEHIDFNAKQVYVVPARGHKSLKFSSSDIEIHTRVVKEIKQILIDVDRPIYIDEPASQMLESARSCARRVGLLESNVINRRSTIEWFPWIGTRGLRALEIYAKQFGVQCERAESLSLVFSCQNVDFEKYLRHVKSEDVNWESLENYRYEKFDEFIPDELAKRSYLAGSVAVEEAKKVADLELQDR